MKMWYTVADITFKTTVVASVTTSKKLTSEIKQESSSAWQIIM